MSYYNDVNETLNPGWIADAKKINDIQENIKSSQANEIIDLDGPAFVLSNEEDAFELTEVSNIVSVENTVNTNPITWQSLENQYIRRRIDITKNEVKRFKVFLRNSTEDAIAVTANLYTDEFEEDSSISPIESFSVTVPALNSGQDFYFDFGAKHLNRYYHYVEIERTDIVGVDIKLAQATETYIENSASRQVWTQVEKDIFFQVIYANEMTFDIKDSFAVIAGTKLRNFDTHIEIPPASSAADRIDVVYIDETGWVQIQSGKPAGKPIPSTIMSLTDLKIAHVRVPKNCVSTTTMVVDQDETDWKNKLRSQNERLRRLERRQVWDWKYNIPRRIRTEYDTLSEIFDDEAPVTPGEATLQTVEDHIEMGDVTKYILKDTYKTNTYIDTNKTTADHSDHTNGIIKLPVLKEQNVDLAILAKGNKVGEAYGSYSRDTKKASQYMQFVFTSPKNVTVNNYVEFALGHVTVDTCKAVTIRFIDYDANTLVKEGVPIPISQYKNVPRGNSAWRKFTFSSSFTLKKGKKYRVTIQATPKTGLKAGQTAKIYAPVYDSNQQKTSRAHIEYRAIPYPTAIGKGASTIRNYYIPMRIDATGKTYVSSAVIYGKDMYSSLLGPVKTVSAAYINAEVDDDTDFKLEVSVDGGTTWKLYLFGVGGYKFTSPGQHFMYRITLTTSDPYNTPKIKFDSEDGYAVRFILGYQTAEPIYAMSFYSNAFDGNEIIQALIGGGFDGLVFSHYEWLLSRMDTRGGVIDIRLQYYDDDISNWVHWKNEKGNLFSLFKNVDPEYHDYPVNVDKNDKNFYLQFSSTDPTNNYPLYYPKIRYHITLRKKDDDVDEESPRIYMLGTILELS